MNTSLTQWFRSWIVSYFLVSFIAAVPVQAQTMIDIRSDWNTSMDNKMEWFHNARYGMKIHWGPDALPRTPEEREWLMINGKPIYGTSPWRNYEELLQRDLVFNPIDFDAEEWVDITRNAGMKYIVFIAKHHNGFSMYDSKYTDFDIVDYTPFDRGPLKELADACLDAGVRLGVYYSISDLHHPEFHSKLLEKREIGRHYYPNPDAVIEIYVEYMKNQLRELFTNYGKIDILLGDNSHYLGDDGAFLGKEYPKIMDMIRSIQPNVIINHQDLAREIIHRPKDYLISEESYPELNDLRTYHNFQVDATMNGSWMYHKDTPDWITAEMIIHNLAHVASMGGNYTLNVGPTPEGIFPKESVDVLLEAGDWLKKYGESIYETSGTQWEQPKWGRITHRILADGTTRLYLHVFDWPEDGRLVLDTVRRRPTQAYALRSIPRENYKVGIEGNAYIVVTLNGRAWDPVNSVVVLDVDKAR